jgi:hypothetical protein
MKNTESAKTLTASLPQDAQALFAWIAEPENLPRWHSSFCRSIRRENGSLLVESPRGSVPIRFIRDDHSLVLDLLAEVAEGIELTNAIRVLRSGEGSELVWTLIKPEDVSESLFNEQFRWAGSALQNLRKVMLTEAAARAPELIGEAPAEALAGVEPAQTTQEPSAAETASLPQSGKKLFIGNLSYAWTDVELRAHFAEQGSVTLAEVARFRGRGGRSRGFGFVEMASEAEAQTAIEKLHGGTAGGRQIIVRLAKSQESRPPAPETATSADSNQPSEPGNAIVTRKPQLRHQRPSSRGRSRRPPQGGPSRGTPRSRSPEPRQSYNSGVDITNKSGYEIFPRGSSDKSAPDVPSRAPSRSRIEASPYMEDTGDIENHGRPRRPHSRGR